MTITRCKRKYIFFIHYNGLIILYLLIYCISKYTLIFIYTDIIFLYLTKTYNINLFKKKIIKWEF